MDKRTEMEDLCQRALSLNLCERSTDFWKAMRWGAERSNLSALEIAKLIVKEHEDKMWESYQE